LVVNSARVLKGKWRHSSSQWRDEDSRLIDFMMRGRHGTPFEHNYFQFRVTVPIFAQRDWMRHRVGHSFNEISTRWQEMGDLGVYSPPLMREQLGKAHLYQFQDLSPGWKNSIRRWRLIRAQNKALKTYRRMLKDGFAREQAMAVLPMGVFTQFVWSCNARSIMHFLSLRTEPTARKEIREVAAAVEHSFATWMPETHAAWVRHGRVAP
jgi:thymidylate synthase (FAD)